MEMKMKMDLAVQKFRLFLLLQTLALTLRLLLHSLPQSFQGFQKKKKKRKDHQQRRKKKDQRKQRGLWRSRFLVAVRSGGVRVGV